MTRATSDGDVRGPNDRVDLETALRMHTFNSAYASSFEEGLKGRIEVGKLADVVVAADDLHRLPPKALRDLPIDMPFVGGEVVCERA